MQMFNEYARGLSTAQKRWYVSGLLISIAIVGFGLLLLRGGSKHSGAYYSVDQNIKQIAPGLGVTGKALARDLGLPIEVSKKKPLRSLGITQDELDSVTGHLESHDPTSLTYFVYVALVLFGWLYLVRLGRPDRSPLEHRKHWYNRTPYVIALVVAVLVSGFVLGKSPNPMEGIVKVFKAMVGLYPSVWDKLIALAFFLVLAAIGNKLVCGWACPFGAIQELVYSIPILQKLKQRKLPFAVTNAVRGVLFLVGLVLLFGLVGNHKGYVVYHGLNPFNLFDLDFESSTIALTVIASIALATVIYRPFCHLVCPFGLVSWFVEKLSLAKVRIDPAKCTKCGACAAACPSQAALGRIKNDPLPPDCFSCARCLNVCPHDAIEYSVRQSGGAQVILAVASGKGGTGKTTVSTNLAFAAASQGLDVTYLDCDVEEPNGHIFLKPEIEKTTSVSVPVPVVDEDKCTSCGKCREICQYSAIARLGKTILTFPNLCHGCGGCSLVCPTGAITEAGREVGFVEEGAAGGIGFVHGKLRVGEAMSPPLIREVRKRIPPNGLSIIDAPPGTSCPVIQSVRGSDYVLLVTEPTPFGLNDLKLAVEMLRVMKLPFGVVVNRADIGDEAVLHYCNDQSIDVLLSIPDDRRIAEAYSRGLLAAESLPEYSAAFDSLLEEVTQVQL